MYQHRKTSFLWFSGFTAIFACLMVFVFWGAWSPDVAPVMPDDGVRHPLSFATQIKNALNAFVTRGKFAPFDIFWDFPLVSRYYLQEFKYAFSAYCAALGLAYFLRGHGLSRVASYGAGLLLGFCGYWFSLFSAGHFGWFVWMTYGIFAFGFADRAVRFNAPRHWLLLGASVGWASFPQPDLWLLFTVFTGVYTLAVCWWERKFAWKGFLLAALALIFIGMPGFYDAFANALTSREKQISEVTPSQADEAKADDASSSEARWIFVTNWSLPPNETVEFFWPRVNGDTSCPMTLQLARAAGKDVRPYTGALGRPINATQGNYRQHSLYVGLITCLLALIGVISPFIEITRTKDEKRERKDDKTILFFACAALLLWFFSMGRYFEIVYRLVYALPFGDTLRAPVKWHHLTEFCLCVLAGFGLEFVRVFFSEKIGKKVSLVCVGLLAFIGAADLARVDRLYCAPLDLSFVKGSNAAADRVKASGGGCVAELVEGNRGMVAWNFQVHEVDTRNHPMEDSARFVFVGTREVAQNAELAHYLKAKTTLVGTYALTQKGIRSAAPTGANTALYKINDVPPPPPQPYFQQIKPFAFTLGFLSLLSSLIVGVYVVRHQDF